MLLKVKLSVKYRALQDAEILTRLCEFTTVVKGYLLLLDTKPNENLSIKLEQVVSITPVAMLEE